MIKKARTRLNFSLKSKLDFQSKTQELGRRKIEKGRTKLKNNKTSHMTNISLV
jgi:hypothetical protein